MKYLSAILALTLLITSCSTTPTADEILSKAIEVHGGNKVNNSTVSFDFREIKYHANYANGNYELTRYLTDSLSNSIKDVLTNTSFNRWVNDTLVTVTDEWKGKYSNSINSVFYFFRLPFNLTDPATILTYLGTSNIDGTNYYKIKVAFNEKGGGEDFEDLFVYWFNADTYTLDYLAYEYATDGGGKRFRKAVNQRYANGWLVSDYINYKPKSLDVNIEQYDQYFAGNGLIKLSEIVNKNVEVAYLQ